MGSSLLTPKKWQANHWPHSTLNRLHSVGRRHLPSLRRRRSTPTTTPPLAATASTSLIASQTPTAGGLMELIRTPKVENVRMVSRYPTTTSTPGTLYLTATHLIFVDHHVKKETWILHGLISTVEKLSITTGGSPLMIRCKHFLCRTFVIPKERDAHDIYLSIIQLSQPSRPTDLYCFHYTAPPDRLTRAAGWDKFDLEVIVGSSRTGPPVFEYQESEFRRMGCPNDHWVMSNINCNYQVCETYPNVLYVPFSATLSMLEGSAGFRSKGRLPALSYRHSNNATICRCSQPLSGLNGRCVEDEQLLTCILRSNPQSKILYLVDTRPKINAMAQRAAGKGYENENFYENIKFQFFGIENIHVMRGSLQKLMDACELKVPSMNAFLAGVEGSGWLRHIKSVIETSSFIAKAVADGISVVVHCSDGWDRTAQTCSLAGLILDPFYRTIDGFECLIEKEWLSFGHKFNDRCGHVQGDSKEMAPVFTQFLDATWQLIQQRPMAFEFNERFLIAIHDHAYSCQFGTFVGNCELERRNLRLSDKTYSLWSFLDSHRDEFVNPIFDSETLKGGPIEVNVSPQCIKFWRGLYNRFEVGVHPRVDVNEVLVATRNHIQSLEDHIKFLEQKISLRMQRKSSSQSSSKSRPSKSPKTSKSSSNQPPESANQVNHIAESSSSCPKKNRLGSLDLDELDSPLKEVEKCMQRLEKCKFGESTSSSEIDGDIFEDEEEEDGYDEDDDDLIPDGHLVEINELIQTLDSVAIDWQSPQNAIECQCGSPFEPFQSRVHCPGCGQLFCVRCIDKRIQLPANDRGPVPVCGTCYKEVIRSHSVDFI